MATARTLEARAAGVLLGLACGDALGVPYEFAAALPADEEPVMKGGGPGGFAPGEWSDDTAMAIAVAQGLLGADSLEEQLDAIARRFLDWFASDPPGVDIQTRAVLEATQRRLGEASVGPAALMRHEAEAYAEQHEHSAGSGALMRTAPVALAYLGDPDGCEEAARAIAALTHPGPLAGDACVLWSEAIRSAVAGEGLGVTRALPRLPEPRQAEWRAWVADTYIVDPGLLRPNGSSRVALQAAHAAIMRGRSGLVPALSIAVHIGDDTDTVAAITGALVGGYAGEQDLPTPWLRAIHGWPGLRAADLARLALDLVGDAVAPAAEVQAPSHPRRVVPHPVDPAVLIGNDVPAEATAVIDLRMPGLPRRDFGGLPVVECWYFTERPPHAQEPWLAGAALAISRLRTEGHTVLVHFPGEHPWPVAVAMAYSTLRGVDLHEAWLQLCRPYPWARDWDIVYFSVRDLAEKWDQWQ